MPGQLAGRFLTADDQPAGHQLGKPVSSAGRWCEVEVVHGLLISSLVQLVTPHNVQSYRYVLYFAVGLTYSAIINPIENKQINDFDN